MKVWENLFSSKILERGYDYYKMGMINSLEAKDYGYQAYIEGTEEYEVRIYVDDEEITEMYCSCPYAEDGNHCKHMAAVLYAIDNEEDCDEDILESHDDLDFENEDIEKIVDAVSEKEIKEFLINLAKNNEEIRSAISVRFSSFDGNQLQSMLAHISAITDKYSRGGYIDYYNTWDYGYEMSSFLSENVGILIQRRKLKEAFKLVNEVFLEVATQDLDDSDGMIGTVAHDCVEYWKNIIKLSDGTSQKEMFNYFKRSLKNGLMVDYMEDIIEQLLIEFFNDKSVIEDKLNYIDSEIKYLAKQYKKNHYASYKLSDFVKQRLLMMHELDYSLKEIRNYRDQYRFLSSIRQMEISEYLEHNDYVKAIEVLKESIELDKDYYGLVHDYKKQLVDIFEKLGNRRSYYIYLEDYVLNDTQYDLEYILKLKSISNDDDWNQYREAIIQNGRSTKVSYLLLEYEENYERLLDEIQKTNNLYLLNEFEKTLKEKLPKETMEIYCQYVISFAKSASNRKMYQEVVRYLKKIKTYPNADEELNTIVLNFKAEYKRKPAMMDELQKAGF